MSSLYSKYVELRTKRLKLQREADVLEQQEKDILYDLTKSLDTSKPLIVLTDPLATFTATRKDAFLVDDWTLLIGHIKQDPGELDLLQRRLTESAAKERWDTGLTVPGVRKDYKWAVKIELKE